MAKKKYFTDESLSTAVSAKSDKSHTHNISDINGLQSSLDSKTNQNAFSNIKISSTTISADIPTDTLTLVAGTNITLTPDATNDKITVSSKDTTYTLSSFGITATAAELNKLDGVTATATQINYLNTATGNIQTQLDSKAASSHNHAASNITSGTLSSDRLPTVPISKGGTGATTASGALTNLGITATASELNYVDGVTSNIQTQLNNKAASSHTHSYLPLSGGNLTGTLGIGNKYELSPAYNYTNGCLIDIGAAKSSTMVSIHIVGNSYNSTLLPINSLYQFYDYGDGTIMQYSGVNLGLALGDMKVYRYNNRLYAHIKQTASYQTLSFTIVTNKSGLSPTVSNTAAHTSGYTDLVTITPKNIALDGHTHKYAGSSSAGGAANSAVKATQDASGNVITSTYATKTELDTAKSNLQTSINGKANSSHTHTIANVTNLQTTLDGKSNTNHTHSYAGSSSVGGAATSANKVNKALTVQLNGGTTEGTNKFTFDGSAAKSVNITASSVGASASGHTHDDRYYTETEIDSKVSTINNAISGKANSSHTHTIANITNLQTTLDGKSGTSHTHKYAGSASVGGSATSAVKLDTSTAGDANTPVYFSGGKPVACTSLDLNTSGSSASCTGNAATATKLQTARNISLGTGVTGTATSFNGTGNITIPVTDVKEAYLSWGGKSISGGVSPIDAASSNIHSANRFAFAKPAGITIEYSTNGSTYSTYSTTDSAKVNLVSGNGNTYYIGGRSTSTTINDKLRITLNATNMGLYTRLRKLLINISTSYAAGSNVIIEKAMKGSETTFSTIGTYQISGWSGWNSIPINAAFGGGSNQTNNIAVLRLTFGITGVNSEQTSNALSVSDIIGIGDTYWSYPSTMAKTGHLYTYDSSQNATFPAKVTSASGFVGALSGNATSATTASSCTGNSATATKLATARTISLTGDVTGSASFDGSANASITATVADDSHNHIISNVDGLQSALDGKSATSHNHDSAYIKKSLQFTADNGAQKLSYYKDDGKNILTEIAALSTGFYTMYSQSGTAGNPKTTEAWRFMIHKTGNTTGWVQGYGSLGSVYTNYQDGDSGWRGWRCIWDNDPEPLWSGQMYMSSPNSTPQTVTPSKKLSECRTGWLLLWSDYDPGSGSNDADFATTIIPKNNPSGGKWGGKSFLCDIPRYIGSNTDDVDTERRIIKVIYVHDDCIKGSYQGDADERNDVVLRAVFEI